MSWRNFPPSITDASEARFTSSSTSDEKRIPATAPMPIGDTIASSSHGIWLFGKHMQPGLIIIQDVLKLKQVKENGDVHCRVYNIETGNSTRLQTHKAGLLRFFEEKKEGTLKEIGAFAQYKTLVRKSIDSLNNELREIGYTIEQDGWKDGTHLYVFKPLGVLSVPPPDGVVLADVNPLPTVECGER